MRHYELLENRSIVAELSNQPTEKGNIKGVYQSRLVCDSSYIVESMTNDKVIFTCGSGITACIIMLAATIAGYQHTTLYDGSWSDWDSDETLPVEQG